MGGGGGIRYLSGQNTAILRMPRPQTVRYPAMQPAVSAAGLSKREGLEMTSQVGAPDFTAVKHRQQATWASGNYSLVAGIINICSELLCEAVDLRAGQRVLDVATGNGNTALAAARRSCQVTGIDYVPALLEHARERAAAERLSMAL